MTAPTITTLPTAPLQNDSPANFNTRAFAWVGAIAGFTTELNAFGAYLNSYVAPTAPLTGGSIPVFGASGSSHSAGAVPDPGSTAGTTRFLCENATWRVIAATDLPLAPSIASPIWASSMTLDLSTIRDGGIFRITLGGNTTIALTGGTDGQRFQLALTQDATGSRTVTLASGSFTFGSSVTSFTATTTASKRDRIGCVYVASAGKADVVAVAPGF